MKNLSISGKLIIGFGSMLVLMIATALVSVMSIERISEQTQGYAKYVVPNSRYLYKMQIDVRAASQYLLSSILEDNQRKSSEALNEVKKCVADFTVQKEAMENNQRDHSLNAELEKINTLFTEVTEARNKVMDLVTKQTEEAKSQAYKLYLNEYKPALDKLIDHLVQFEDVAQQRSDAQSAAVENLVASSWQILISSLIISIVLAFVLILVIRRSILKPVMEVVNVYDEMSKGNLQATINYDSKDELGKMARSIRKTNELFTAYIQDISEKLELISQGDMRIEMNMDYIGDFAVIKEAIAHTVSSLDQTLQTINVAAEQVSLGASQISGAAQTLASGATEQASSVEELSVTVNKVSGQAQTNSENVKTAAEYVEQTGIDVETGNQYMEQLTEAMQEINSASDQIANITKVIEDIAFQTNILALNAAIEAARAGSAGKGFAVVADEVRNLAAKSAEAAKKTADLIEDSVVTVTKGTKLTLKTAQILIDIREKMKRAIDSIMNIEQASVEQAAAIEQIKQALDQVSSIVQTNAATAEENSATSEEISAQAGMLYKEVTKFKLTNEYKKEHNVSIAS